MTEAARVGASPSAAVTGAPNPWLVTMGWISAAAFILGLAFLVLGRKQFCSGSGEYCVTVWSDFTPAQHVGLGLLSAGVLLGSVAMAASAIVWQLRRS